jgi:hypothetical protein
VDICLKEDVSEVLDLTDEVNIDNLSYLQIVYDRDGYLFASYLNIFKLLGITDELFIFSSMDHIMQNPFPYNSEEDCINNDSNLKKLHKRSKIKMNKHDYSTLSRIHAYILISDYTLFKKDNITHEDMDFLINSIEDIYADLGRLYTNIMLNPKQKNHIESVNIPSLGGQGRANKYNQYKKEIFEKWLNNNYHSYALFAREYAGKYNLSTKTIENWLSSEFSIQQK